MEDSKVRIFRVYNSILRLFLRFFGVPPSQRGALCILFEIISNSHRFPGHIAQKRRIVILGKTKKFTPVLIFAPRLLIFYLNLNFFLWFLLFRFVWSTWFRSILFVFQKDFQTQDKCEPSWATSTLNLSNPCLNASPSSKSSYCKTVAQCTLKSVVFWYFFTKHSFTMSCCLLLISFRMV